MKYLFQVMPAVTLVWALAGLRWWWIPGALLYGGFIVLAATVFGVAKFQNWLVTLNRGKR